MTKFSSPTYAYATRPQARASNQNARPRYKWLVRRSFRVREPVTCGFARRNGTSNPPNIRRTCARS